VIVGGGVSLAPGVSRKATPSQLTKSQHTPAEV